MTVISAMKFNNNHGAIISDTQSSTSNRKYDIATKLHHHSNDAGTVAVIGGTGSATFLGEANIRLGLMLSGHKDRVANSYDMARAITESVAATKRKFIDNYVTMTYGISESEMQSGTRVTPEGRVPIDRLILEHYTRIVRGQDDFSQLTNNGFVVLGKDMKGLQLYSVSSEVGLQLWPYPYNAMGSGADIADNELYEFVERMPREKRNDISPTAGVAALIYATDRASRRNMGVGGTPHIAILKGDEYITPAEESSRLAVEIVNGSKANLLPEEFMHEALDRLLYNAVPTEEVERAMWTATSDQAKLSRVLRGYK
jgi:hypothetical protein